MQMFTAVLCIIVVECYKPVCGTEVVRALVIFEIRIMG